MRKITKLIAPAIIAAVSISAITPAMAQPAPHRQPAAQHQNARPGQNNVSIRSDIQNLRQQIDRAAQRRTITQRQATNLKREANEIQRLYTQYARNGLTRQETRTLENRINKVNAEIRQAKRSYDDRGYRR